MQRILYVIMLHSSLVLPVESLWFTDAGSKATRRVGSPEDQYKDLRDYINKLQWKGTYNNITEQFHDPWLSNVSNAIHPIDRLYVNYFDKEALGRDAIAPRKDTPDFRLPEPPMIERNFVQNAGKEYNRPLRITPWDAFGKYIPSKDKPEHMACFSAVVYKKYKILSTGANLTKRHVLTTASSIETVLPKYKQKKTLTNILGLWAPTTNAKWRESYNYHDIIKIYYHPKWNGITGTNRTHPLPCVYDLSVLVLMTPLDPLSFICPRGGSSMTNYGYGTPPRVEDLLVLTGHQFVKDVGRNPLPFMLYAVKTRRMFYQKCPVTTWGWFYCICSSSFARLGFDSGGGLLINGQGDSTKPGGLIGSCAFSMKLRSKNICHYFTVLDRHSVLDFLYDSYMSLAKPAYLDIRYEHKLHQSIPTLNASVNYPRSSFGNGQPIYTRRYW